MGNVLKTVRRNFEGWTKREIKEATLARILQSRTGNMSDTKLKHMVSVNGLRNSPVRPEHVTNASRIFGPNVAALEGKTVRRPSPRVHTDGGITIPDDFHRLHHVVTLVADIFFVNGVAFLMTQSRKIKMYTVEHTPSRKASALADSLKKIIKIYGRGGFMVNLILMDQEFDKIVDRMDMAIVNTTAAREHVTDAERGIRTIKDSGRCTVAEFRRIGVTALPKQVIIHMVYFAVFWLNAAPAENGISEIHSPREIVLKRSVDFKLHCRGTFGQYVMAHVDPDVTNDMNGRTFQGLYLGPTGNLQGTVKALDLVTGCVKKVKHFTEVPMPDSARDLINKWGKRYQKEKKI